MLSHELIAQYGVLIVFLSVFGSSVGLPLPASPTLVIAGASLSFATDGLSSTFTQSGAMLAAAVIGGALGDLVWFQSGKRYRERTFHCVCSLLMAHRTRMAAIERFFGRWGVRLLLIARFVPGLSLIAAPLCGAMAVQLRSFVLHDCVGLGLWALVALSVGAMFASQIDRTVALFFRYGWQALMAIVVALALVIAYRHVRRLLPERTRERLPIGAGASTKI
ncbi:DedA family protein [Paraburkholderia rhizosphaerae]|uniref:Membrane protein DedA with SNARE-associated domain n=1 Tax=Paraburkholderia rhizosphaerae TaxID=480658 RepID=A0A4R8LSY3_9BURK|nr:DedA family protein [Paraburkholderia rhizosphaerae]TDY50783.1 membrane protein DedA with SNARE-associated domain [Paraburkholderia rhizosphaerae]